LVAKFIYSPLRARIGETLLSDIVFLKANQVNFFIFHLFWFFLVNKRNDKRYRNENKFFQKRNKTKYFLKRNKTKRKKNKGPRNETKNNNVFQTLIKTF
jgi:hypothetical protein